MLEQLASTSHSQHRQRGHRQCRCLPCNCVGSACRAGWDLIHLHMDVVDDVQGMLQVVKLLCCPSAPVPIGWSLFQRKAVWDTCHKASVLQGQEGLLHDGGVSRLLHVLKAAQTWKHAQLLRTMSSAFDEVYKHAHQFGKLSYTCSMKAAWT